MVITPLQAFVYASLVTGYRQELLTVLLLNNYRLLTATRTVSGGLLSFSTYATLTSTDDCAVAAVHLPFLYPSMGAVCPELPIGCSSSYDHHCGRNTSKLLSASIPFCLSFFKISSSKFERQL